MVTGVDRVFGMEKLAVGERWSEVAEVGVDAAEEMARHGIGMGDDGELGLRRYGRYR